MQRRFLADTINEDAVMQRLGVLANLLFDRLLTLTDEAGLVAGEPKVVWGRCCAEMPGVEVKHVETAINKLVESGFLFRREWNGRIVLLFKPEAFNRIQGFRKDYKRRFNFGELSQLVWQQGLHGFTVNPNGSAVNPNGSAVNPNGSTATVAVAVAVSGTGTELHTLSSANADGRTRKSRGFKGYTPEFERFWSFYPRSDGKGAAFAAFEKLSAEDKHQAVELAEAFKDVWSLATDDRKEFTPHGATWLNERRFDGEPAQLIKAWEAHYKVRV